MRSPGRLIGGASQPIPTRVREAIEPVIGASELELLGVELGREGRRVILWVFIDHPDGVTIDDCARISPEVSAALDVDDPIVEAYELRVSSPGLDRPLFCEADFTQFAGEEVQIQLSTAQGGRRKFTGKIGALDEDRVALTCADGEHLIPLSSIHRARLRYELSIGQGRDQRGK